MMQGKKNNEKYIFQWKTVTLPPPRECLNFPFLGKEGRQTTYTIHILFYYHSYQGTINFFYYLWVWFSCFGGDDDLCSVLGGLEGHGEPDPPAPPGHVDHLAC